MCMWIIYGVLLKSKVRFSTPGAGLRFCLSNKFPGDVYAAGPRKAAEKEALQQVQLLDLTGITAW